MVAGVDAGDPAVCRSVTFDFRDFLTSFFPVVLSEDGAVPSVSFLSAFFWPFLSLFGVGVDVDSVCDVGGTGAGDEAVFGSDVGM